jgi:hypothetical protein
MATSTARKLQITLHLSWLPMAGVGRTWSVGSDRRIVRQTDSNPSFSSWIFILSPFTSHTPQYTLLDQLSDTEEGKDLASSQSADDAVSAESISENDPASSPLAKRPGYAMTRTLGKTGWAIYWGDDGNSVQFTSVQRSRTYQPALVESVLLGSQSESNRSLRNLCRGLNA